MIERNLQVVKVKKSTMEKSEFSLEMHLCVIALNFAMGVKS